jgi:hypothetical protein
MTEAKQKPLHISQAFNLSKTEADLEFFDANLKYDTRLFIDPFLLKRSSKEKERTIFKRFGVFFKHAHEMAMSAKSEGDLDRLKKFLTFPEPREINLGYTKESNKGSGLGSKFATALFQFFLNNAARRLIIEEYLYPDNSFNPAALPIFAKDMGDDGISDLTADLMIDYLIEYTQEKCIELGIPKKELPVREGFDFDNMEWTGGYHAELPENPLRPGEPIIFVPKRLLREQQTITFEDAKKTIIGILKTDANLGTKFQALLSTSVKDIGIEDLNKVLLQEESLLTQYLKSVEKKPIESYDFEKDFLAFLAFKNFADYFKDDDKPHQVVTCEELLSHTERLILLFKKRLEDKGGWKDMWVLGTGKNDRPRKEAVFGRVFGGMGEAYFDQAKNVLFDYEVGTGTGFVDFRVALPPCKINIELKWLYRTNPTGVPPLKAYLHGIRRQLPKYIEVNEAHYGIYITGQHFNDPLSRTKKKAKNHSSRVLEIKQEIPEVEKAIRLKVPKFQKLVYENIDLSPKLSPSKI